ncbi:MAG: pantoate--beta-alanine ligase [Candidatus Omnitrophota bacterium]|nr:pantoate--beta-alanine ligase [Candidatus Omnitrophota bacterium]
MRIIRDPRRLNRLLKGPRYRSKSIGFVPTMGALHPGHLSLIKQARQDNDTVVVSIFINPGQFGPKEDLNKYPRPLKNDLALCRKARVDLVFLPDSEIMYPEGFCTFVHVEKLANILCAATRPGHFRGVTTVVAKLLNIVAPGVLYLGQKDAQQAVIIKRMVSDLNFPVKVKVMPTVREKSGLALSSRNEYLGEQERKDALVLFRALNLAKVLIRGGAKDTVRIISRLKQLINKHKNVKIDYIAVMDSMNLKPLKRVTGNSLVALAVYIGKTRLIDNILI